MAKGICSDCGRGIEVFREVDPGDYIVCPKCGIPLQVIGTHPLTLTAASRDEEYVPRFWEANSGKDTVGDSGKK